MISIRLEFTPLTYSLILCLLSFQEFQEFCNSLQFFSSRTYVSIVAILAGETNLIVNEPEHIQRSSKLERGYLTTGTNLMVHRHYGQSLLQFHASSQCSNYHFLSLLH